MTQDEMHDRLSKEFGTTIWKWPPILRRAPRWWQRSMKRQEARVNSALAAVGKGPVTLGMRDLFWEQIRLGQDIYEDAGGYVWRCWCAALGLPFRAPTFTYSGFCAASEIGSTK